MNRASLSVGSIAALLAALSACGDSASSTLPMQSSAPVQPPAEPEPTPMGAQPPVAANPAPTAQPAAPSGNGAGSEVTMPGEIAPVAPPTVTGPARLELLEVTIPELQVALETRLVTPLELVQAYQARIAAYDRTGPALRAILAPNPQAEAEASSLGADCEDRAARGPLCGIPVLVKDNIDAAGLPTTAGSVSLAASVPARDAFLTRKLREAGAVLLGKATLTEFANFLGTNMPSGYSSLGGYGMNPYDPRPQPGSDGRPVLTPGGSSSGSSIAVSANVATVAVGTETSGSILSPASSNGIVGIKPTLGLVSRAGILPITADQDTAGPLARTVGDAARLLGVIAGFDPDDPATEDCLQPGNCFSDYTQFLDAGALDGARLALPPVPAQRQALMQAAADVLEDEGASVQAIGQLPGLRGVCSSAPLPGNCSSVLLYGFHRDLNNYLAAIPDAPVGSLAALIQANMTTPDALKYGQSLALAAQALDVSAGSADTQRYQADRAQDLSGSRAALDAAFAGADGMPGTEDDVDALLFNANVGAALPAMAGYPSITVPGGFVAAGGGVQEPNPSGFTFTGPRFSEPRLIALAFAFEQATLHRDPPSSTPALPGDTFVR